MTDVITAERPAAPSAAAPQPVPLLDAPPQRLLSLDVFRGITIAGMLLVNNPGSWSHIYGPLQHASWNGWTPTDLIFPFFLFIVGVAMTYSFARLVERGAERAQLFLKATKRAAIIFGLGLVLHSFPWWSFDYSHLRIPGVLQRIAICFLAASAVVLATGWRGKGLSSGWRAQALIAAVLLFGYWGLQALVPVPGGGRGVLEPGKDLGAYIDRAVFGASHLWSNARTWDPEGLLSTIPAVATVLLGVLVGHWIRSDRNDHQKLVGLFVAGNAGLVLGVIWNVFFPVNKNLWTSSYVLFTAGMACHFLAMCYWLIDTKGRRRWAQPFVWFGMNSIAAFFLSSFVARLLVIVTVPSAGGGPIALKTWIYQNLYAPVFQAEINASLAFALTYVLFWTAVMALMYRSRIFIKV